MRDELSNASSPRLRRGTSGSQNNPRRAVLPLPADAVDAAFADGVQLKLENSLSEAEAITYSEVVDNVTKQLEKLEIQRRQLKSLLAQATSSPAAEN